MSLMRYSSARTGVNIYKIKTFLTVAYNNQKKGLMTSSSPVERYAFMCIFCPWFNGGTDKIPLNIIPLTYHHGQNDWNKIHLHESRLCSLNSIVVNVINLFFFHRKIVTT